MAWVCCNKDGSECITKSEPYRLVAISFGIFTCTGGCIKLPHGSIKKLIGRNLGWDDEPVKLEKSETFFIRYDEIPPNERSSIWRGEEKIGEEQGVSVYEAHKNLNGTYSPVLPMPASDTTFDTFIHFVKYYSGKEYLVTGDLLPFTGTDGEPLIKNVKIIQEL